METAARTIREEADILLVIGIGGSYLGAKAALDFLPSADGTGVLFLGNDMSPSISRRFSPGVKAGRSPSMSSPNPVPPPSRPLRSGWFWN